MPSKYFSIFLLTFITLNLHSQTQFNVKVIEGDSILGFQYEILDIKDSHNNFETKELSVFTSKLFDSLNSLPENKNQPLFYIHGMWGGRRFAFNRTFNMLDDFYLSNSESDVGVIVSLIWPGNKMDYKVNKDKLYNIAPQISDWFHKFLFTFHYFNHVDSDSEYKLDLLAHSLGTELTKEILCGIDHELYEKALIDELILAAPDLVNDVFDSEDCFGPSLKLAKRTHVYYSSRDLTLSVSNNLNDQDRLGRTGPSDLITYPETVYFIDVSSVKDDKNMPDLITGHSYFRASPIVSNDMNCVLKGDTFEDRETVDEYRNCFMLIEN